MLIRLRIKKTSSGVWSCKPYISKLSHHFYYVSISSSIHLNHLPFKNRQLSFMTIQDLLPPWIVEQLKLLYKIHGQQLPEPCLEQVEPVDLHQDRVGSNYSQCSVHPAWLFDIRDEPLYIPNYIVIIISQYKDPYKPTGMECQPRGFERCSIF